MSKKPSVNDIAANGSADKNSAGNAAGNPMWGGHFARGPAEIMASINQSLAVDKRLWREDIAGSRAHAEMLAKQGIIGKDDAANILRGLAMIEQEILAGTFPFRVELEDIHMNIEARLKELIGDAAGRLHTARSRNDQVVTDFRLFVRQACEEVSTHIAALAAALLARAEEHAETILPGFTHFQPAQPVTLGHHLLAYVAMFERDHGRFRDAHARMNECPLGACALAGTSFPIDRAQTAAALGFARPMTNSLDAVSDRDFVLEFLAASSILAVHLSRLAEELVLWSSPLIGFIRLSEAFTSGSSIMPQKRNPDAAELVRGKSGQIFGTLFGLLTTLKALPLAYNKDLQEDKAPLFRAVDDLALCLGAMEGMVRDFRAEPNTMLAAASAGYSTATDLADWLVQTLHIPFRDAHHITGKIVRLAEAQGVELSALSVAAMQQIEPRITEDVVSVLTVQASVQSRKSLGGTSPTRVREAIAASQHYWKNASSAAKE